MQGPLSQSARDQETAMFQHLVSCCHPPAAETSNNPPPSTKRQRQDPENTAMPQVGLNAEPTSGDKGKGKAKGKGKGKGKGRNKSRGPGQGQSQNKSAWWNTSGSGNGALTDWDAQAWSHAPSGGSSSMQPPTLGQMARLLLRHEKQLQAVQQDMKLHFFFRPDPPGSVLPFMTQVAKRWHELMDQNKVQSSLRETMLRELIQELKGRIKGFTAAAMTEMQKKANEMEWDLGEIEKLMHYDSSLRECTTIESELQDSVELRQDGDMLWRLFNSLINCAVLHLLGARLRRDRPVDSSLAQSLQHFLWEGRSLIFPQCPCFISLIFLRSALPIPPCKTCYMNSALNALLVVILSTGSTHEADLGQLRHVYQALRERATPLDISKLLTWVMFISPWATPFQQHDVGEFVQHIAPRIRSPLFVGMWQARQTFGDHCQVVDSGPAFSPVLLPLTGDATLQNFIDQWHAQDDSAIQQSWITEDSTPARVCNAADFTALAHNAYLVWAIRSPAEHSGPVSSTSDG
ncbi:unnamed protein product [Symbiodinium sp. CCMP2592]|nr:unnamed protein product [Symbiodinium sp. CCMP2592]